MSDLDSRNAGLGGQALPPGGNVNEWQAGRSIRAWNEAALAGQNASTAGQPFTPMPAPVVVHTPINFAPWQGGLRGHPILAVGGLIALIFVGVPFYQYSIPLWLALYPGPALAAGAVYTAVYMSLANDHTINGAIVGLGIAFIAAWPIMLVEHAIAAKQPTYWKLRNLVRLPLLGIWAIYALSLREANLAHVPDITKGGLPHMVFSLPHIGLALVLVAVMAFWLSKFQK